MKDGPNPKVRTRAGLGPVMGATAQPAIFGILLLLFLSNVVSNITADGAAAAGIAMSAPHYRDGHSLIVAQNVPPSLKPAETRATDIAATPPSVDAVPKQSDVKVKDAWDKAQIISGFLATVVLAGAALLINAGIQRAQIRASAANTKIEVARRNNDAQLALTERTAEVQRQLQQSTLAGQLVEHLASGSALRKQIAIVALRRSLPSEMYQEIITIVVRSETDPEVRKTALGQAATLPSAEPSVVQAIAEAATDTARSSEERGIATNTVQELGLRSVAPGGTFILASSGGRQMSLESGELGGGVFTHYLLRGLLGEARHERDGSVRFSELAHFVVQSVRHKTVGAQAPVYMSSGAESDPIILGAGKEFTKTVVVAIGNSDYHEPMERLQYGASDANRFADVFQQQGSVVNRIINATRDKCLTAIRVALEEIDHGSLLIFYYSGHAAINDGKFLLLPVDADSDKLWATGISTAELNALIRQTPARVKILFLDTAFSGMALEGAL
jgi:hypothetical protein